MRFEGKHTYFKNMTHTIKSSYNLPLSLAKIHQSMESAASLQNEHESSITCSLLSDDILFGKGRLLMAHDREYAINTITRF